MTHRLIKDGELILYGDVGSYFANFGNEYFTATEVIAALSEFEGADVPVRLNSGGGVAYDGVSIHNSFKAYEGKVTIYVDGIAASAASIIAMAGHATVMRDGSMLMIHNASGLTLGTKEDHQKSTDALGKLDKSLAGIYARRSGKDVKAVSKMMTDETWLTAEEAVEEGFASNATADTALEPMAFNYRAYEHAPARLLAIADRFTNSIATQAERDWTPKPPASAADNGDELMDLKGLTLSGLREARPDLITEIEASVKIDDKLAAAKAEGAEAERVRIKGIEENTLPGHAALTATLKFDGKTSPAEAAVAILRAEKALGGKHLAAMTEDEKKLKGLAPEFKAANGDSAAKPGAGLFGEAKWRAEYQGDTKLQAEFLTEADYLAVMKAEASGNVRRMAARPAA